MDGFRRLQDVLGALRLARALRARERWTPERLRAIPSLSFRDGDAVAWLDVVDLESATVRRIEAACGWICTAMKAMIPNHATSKC